ncbi:MAG TPA: hypothetical protein VE134_08750, partial [Methanomicrobiales archaeon]|nr:hypothetical protein [Methanomicrobiales archaeon]
MPSDEPPVSRQYLPNMSGDYSQISDTARAVNRLMLPRILSCLESMKPLIASMPAGAPFVIADYGAADGANSSEVFTGIIEFVRAIHPSRAIRLVYIDIADPAPFHRFWERSHLAALENVSTEYIQRSFYDPIPELRGRVHLGFSSTAMHWMDTRTEDATFFQHPTCIQPNQIPGPERQKFAEKWKNDWRRFFDERSRELADGGALFLANLTDLGQDRWPASAGYNNLRDSCCSLCREGYISAEELNAIFIPSYFAAPDTVRDLLGEDGIRQHFSTLFFEAMTAPCAYFTRMQDRLDDIPERRRLAFTLAHSVRAWSESSLRVGLSAEHREVVDLIYQRLEDAFFATPT